MKTKTIHNLIKLIVVIGASSLFAVSLQAGRGGQGGGKGGNGGECPQGFEPGTRMQQECTNPQGGSGRQNKGSGQKGSKGQNGQRGSGSGSGKGNGSGNGTGNPEDCPNFGG